MILPFCFLSCLAISSLSLACPEEAFNLHKRAGGSQDWNYESTYNWGSLNTSYATCQTGTTQSPIPLSLTQGLSSRHIPSFSSAYSSVPGALYNWGYGPAFTVGSGNIESAPSMTFDNETVYLKGWHIHAPADHTVQGDRAKAELHLVHIDAAGRERAVVAIRIDPGNGDSKFFSQITNSSSPMPSFTSTTQIPITLNLMQALSEVNMFADFWTYRGSLTSPPCTEGMRWWVARNTLFVGNGQMQAILGVSTFSSRVEQEVWLHGINE
jgi:carbonic anhydrase